MRASTSGRFHLLPWIGALLLCGCFAQRPENRALDSWNPEETLRESALLSPELSGELLLVLTFSGGGTRAAAFAYGVLQELAATTVTLDGRQRRLFDEIDLVSSVSGGSFTSAYLGLKGEGIFDDFEEVFLRRNVQGRLIFEVLRPINWPRLFRLDRSQLAARYYDRAIFDGATFSDLARPGAPQVIINATDLSTAARFPFSPLTFGMICSDLGNYSVANAVTASSAVPIVFPTVRLRNRGGSCGFEIPEAFVESETDLEQSPIGRIFREDLVNSYTNSEERRYIHLLDGGISDNLGLRNAIATFSMVRDPKESMRKIRHEGVREILFVVVNAETASKKRWEVGNRAASALEVVSGLTSSQMRSANRITIELARHALHVWKNALSRPGHPVDFELVEVDFAAVDDPAEEAYLSNIETSFRLSDEKVDRLIVAARQILRDSPEFARALGRMGE